jgi:pilus assembly protein CpaC
MQTQLITWHRNALFFAAICGFGLVGPSYAQTLGQPAAIRAPAQGQPGAGNSEESPSEPRVRIKSDKSNLKIIERFSKVVELEAKITKVDGFDPEVINVSALTVNQIRVQAVAPGVTTMTVFDEYDHAFTIEVFVYGDVRHLQAYIDQLFPHSSVKAVAVRDSVVLRGWVTKPETITHLVQVAEMFYPNVLNQMNVGGMQQVKLKVRVMEVQRSKVRALGINLYYLNRNGYLATTPGSLTPVATLSAPFGGPPGIEAISSSLSDTSISSGFVGDHNIFNAFIDALKEENLLKIMAEPELVATNGRPATMLAGGEFPILVPQSLGTTTIEWREFGVRLEAVPIILGQGRVRLELQPEVSERDFSNAVDVSGFTVPGLTTRRVNTQVEMRFGQTFMLAGLLSMRNTAQTDKVPFFGELPWVGAAFRRVRYDEAETELVILVTPELVAPIDCQQIPPGGPGLFTTAPTDRELFRDGMIEIPSYGGRCPTCGPGHCGPGGCESGDSGVIINSQIHESYEPPTNGESQLAPAPQVAPPAPSNADPTTGANFGNPTSRFPRSQSPRAEVPSFPKREAPINGPSANSGIPFGEAQPATKKKSRFAFWKRDNPFSRRRLPRRPTLRYRLKDQQTEGSSTPVAGNTTSELFETRQAQSAPFGSGLLKPRPGLIEPTSAQQTRETGTVNQFAN